MLDKSPYQLFASAAALSLALSQAALAQTEALPATQAAAIPPPPAPLVSPPPAPAAPQVPAVTPPLAAEAPATPAAPPAPVEALSPAVPAAEAPAAPAAAPSPAEKAHAAHAAHAEAAMKRMEERQAEMLAKRKQRYEELRKRAEAAGLTLPETPPWEEAGFTPPEMPAMPEMPSMPEMPAWPDQAGMGGMSGMEGMGGPQGQDWQARREQAWQAMRDRAAQRGVDMPEQAPWSLLTPEEHRAHLEQMRQAATPEERAALRDQHWAEMRERAAAKGTTLPETPPWKEAEQRREAMKARWENYRKLIDQMSAEEREAAEAIFGQMPQPPEMPAMPVMPEMGRDMMPNLPYGGNFGAPAPRGYPPVAPGYGGPDFSGPGPGYGGGPGYGAGPGFANPGYGGPGYGGPGPGGYDQPRPWSGANPGQMPAPMMMPNSGYNRW